jgi:leader peptidase (prepilin peptidase)/N-methyltransferase
VELLTAVEFVWIYWLLSRLSFFQQMEGVYSLLVLGFWLFIFSLSIVLIVIDARTQILPDSLVLIGVVAAVARLLVTGRWEFLLTGLGLFLFFLMLFLITGGKGIGFGDVKLAFFIGVVLGWWQWAVVSMFIAFLTGAVVGVILILLSKKTLKSALPFGPFLLGAMLLTKILGDYLWHGYVGILGY